MITLRTACTLEIDEPDVAASDILEQLDLDPHRLSRCVGLVACHADFISSGGLKAVCERLPFDVVGTTTLAAATEKAADLEILTVTVLTSDTAEFSAVLTDSLAEDQEIPIQTALEKAGKQLSGAPALVLAYAPLLQNVGGERLVKLISRASGGVPVFGTLTCDHNFDFHDARVIFNGEAYADRMALVLLSGPVRCRFLTISVPERKAEKQNAIITASEGNVVTHINGLPFLDYLESIGLTRDAGLEGAKYIPVILDYNDGTPPVARCFYLISPDGSAVCGGEMPEGATFALSSMDAEDVILSAKQILDRVLAMENAGGMLIMSCIVRSITLGVDQLAEARQVGDILAGSLPYQLCYSGGEMCPVCQTGGSTANRFHNFSFAICLFEG